MEIFTELSNKIGLDLDKSNKINDILFFTGAGISVPPPSNFPIGVELHRMLLEYAEKHNNDDAKKRSKELIFEKTVSRLSKKYNDINEINPFLNIFSNIFGVRTEDEPISITPLLCNHKSNDYHKFFNWHIKNGGKHFTVNIDQFIEMANLSSRISLYTKEKISEENIQSLRNDSTPISFQGYLLKIHGDIYKDEWLKQGYLYQNVQNFSSKLSKIFDEEIKSAKFVIFIGYGGVDKFDITPYFETKNNEYFQNTNAIWFSYGGNEDIKFIEPEESQKKILSKFKSHCVLETIKIENFLNHLFISSPAIINTEMDKSMNGREIETYLKNAFGNLKPQS